MEFPNMAVCGNCGAVFRSAIQIRGDYKNATLKNNRQSCPHCKQMVMLPEGVFSSLQNAATVLAEEANPLDRVDALRDALKRIQENPGGLRATLEKTGIRQAERLVDVAPAAAKDRRLWAAALLAAIGYVWENLPEGALSWIELFERVSQLLAS